VRITTINGVEYVDFRARFVGTYSTGVFVFCVLGEVNVDRDKRWTASRSPNDQEPPARHFSIPDHDGGSVCFGIHTIRMRLGYARAQGIL
jgi:hypothetical protein